MKVVILKPEVIEVDPGWVNLTAGMISIIPSFGGLEGLDGEAVSEAWEEDFKQAQMPDFTVEYAGQHLRRDTYPELAREFPDVGGFYEFILPNMQNKVLLDFTDDGEPIMGSVAGFFKSLPVIGAK